MASLYQRKDNGKWVVQWTTAGGQRPTKHFPATRAGKKAAEHFKSKVEQESLGNPYIKFGEVKDAYLKRCASKVKAGLMRQNTLEGYKRKIRHFERFDRRPIVQIRRPAIEEFLEEMLAKFKPRMVIALRGRLYAIFRFAKQREFIAINPVEDTGRDLVLNPAEHKVRAMTGEQRAAFLNAAQAVAPDLYPMLFLLSRTGMRIGEATALKLGDVDLEAGEIHVRRNIVNGQVQERTKTQAGEREVDMSPELAALMAKHVPARRTQWMRQGKLSEPWLFCGRNGWPYDRRNLAGRVKKILEAADLPSHFTLHSLRHTYARLALERGVSLVYIQRQLGHKRIGITSDLYGRWAKVSDKQAAARLDNGHVGVK